MAIKIVDINIKTNYNWQNIKGQSDWNAVKNTNANWQQPLQTAIVGQPIFIEVEVVENNWLGIKGAYNNWLDIKTSLTNWLGLKNW